MDTLDLQLDDLSLEASTLPTSEVYRRRFTLFRPRFLNDPVMYDLKRLILPKLSTYHYIDTTGLRTGPEYSDQLLQSIPGIKVIEHVTDLYKPLSTPIKIPGVNQEGLITEYRRFNRMIRPTRDPSRQEGDDRGLIIYNYSILALTWRYTVNFKSEWIRWNNLYRTIFNKLADVLKESERHQYLDLHLPERIPSLSHLREFSRNKSTSSIKNLRQEGDFLVAELFNFIGGEEGLLSAIPKDAYSKVNFIVRSNDSWVVVNLQWLMDIASSARGNTKTVQIRFLLMLNKMLDISAIVQPIDVESDGVEEEEDGDAKATEGEVDEVTSVLTGGYLEDLVETDELLDDVAEERKMEKELEELDRIRESAKAERMSMDDDDEDSTGEDNRYDTDGFVRDSDQSPLIAKADELLAKNAITPSGYKRLLRAQDRFEAIPDPYGSGKSLIESMAISEEDQLVEEEVISTDEGIQDPTMRVSRVDNYHKTYINKLFKKDVMNVISSIQNFPVAITDYKIEDKTTAINGIEEHVIRLIPALGQPSTIRIPVPTLNENGTFRYSNKDFRMRAQRADLPIRKISPTEVVLSSYAGKNFIRRSTRRRFDYGTWIKEYITDAAQDSETTIFSEPTLSRVVDYNHKLPWIYTIIASVVSDFIIDGVKYVFDYNRRIATLKLTKDELKYEKSGSVIVGRNKNAVLLLTDQDEIVSIVDGVEDPFSDFESLLRISGKRPLPMVELGVYGKDIPVGVCLSYLMGLNNLLKLLNAKVRRTLPGERMALEDYEFAIKFKNETIILDGRDRRLTLVMGGWARIERYTSQYNVALFDEPDVYYPVMDKSGIPSRYLKELDAFNAGFLDPMTIDLLAQMGEPIEYIPLVIRAVELLMDEYVPPKRKDPKSKIELTERVRGYERIPGMIYESLFKAMRSHANHATRADSKIVVNPNEALDWIISDPTTAIENNINPVHALREREVITFGGRYGRSKRAMVAETRKFNETDKGFISEASVDSGDVGVITYLTPNANITTARGTIKLFDEKKDTKSSLVSTPVQLMPAADGDIPKRMGFISVQMGHQISTKEFDIAPYRTGGERSMIGRMSKEFGQVAKGEGTVVELTDKVIKIEYKDKSVASFQLGEISVNAEGTFYPHTLKTSLKKGDKLKKGDVLYYNANFFQPSTLDKGAVDYSLGVLAFTAFREANYTIEDSCAISEALSLRLQTTVSKLRSKVVNFDQDVAEVMKVGQTVELDTPLFQITDAFTAEMDKDDLAKALSRYSTHVLKADIVGTISKVEVFYNGDTIDMSESLLKTTRASESVRREVAKNKGETFHPNVVNRYVRIDGQQLETKQALIVYHISVSLGTSVADKLVFAAQLKSTIGQVMFGKNTTLDGEPVDAMFGAISGINRTVLSVYRQGTVNTYLRYLGEDAYKLWKES